MEPQEGLASEPIRFPSAASSGSSSASGSASGSSGVSGPAAINQILSSIFGGQIPGPSQGAQNMSLPGLITTMLSSLGPRGMAAVPAQTGGLPGAMLGESFMGDLSELAARLGMEDTGRSSDTGVDKAVLDRLPKVIPAAGSECAVCLDDLLAAEGDTQQDCLILPCKHLFHKDCITPWVSQNSHCPVCRHPLPKASGRAADDFSPDDAIAMAEAAAREYEGTHDHDGAGADGAGAAATAPAPSPPDDSVFGSTLDELLAAQLMVDDAS